MTRSEPRLFDFREIAALDESAEIFKGWIAKTSTYFADFMLDVTGEPTPVSVGALQTNTWNAVLDTIDRDDHWFEISLNDKLVSILFAGGEQWQPIVDRLLGVPPKQNQQGSEGKDDSESGEESAANDSETSESKGNDSTARALSAIESSIVELFLENLQKSFCDGWPGNDNLELTISELRTNPRKNRIFRSKELVSNARLDLQFEGQKSELFWIWPKQGFDDLLHTAIDPQWQPAEETATDEMVGKIPMELVGVLGRATIPMSKLSQIQVGQLIRLDSRIDKPVRITLNEATYYEAWPGRIGNQQAMEVTDLASD